MNRIRLVIGCFLLTCPVWLSGQLIRDVMSLSRSVFQEASLPVETQRRLNRIEQEREHKHMRYGQTSDCNSAFLLQAFTRFVQHNDSCFYLQDAPFAHTYTYTMPKMVITNTSHGHELIRGSGAKFNAKKDRLSSVVIDSQLGLSIVNRNDESCDPASFKFSAETEGIHMEGNRIVLDATPQEFAQGRYATEQRIRVTHLNSKTTYVYDLHIGFEDSLSWRGQKKAIAVMSYPTPVFEDLGVVMNLTDKTLTFVHLPLNIHGEGSDGKNGRRGYNGANGTNTYTWTDKEGKIHTVRGTCAQPGSKGEDGEDGTDGGQFFIFVDSSLDAFGGIESITAWIDPGVGGEGGKGGEGGIHGRGSGCSGMAPNGENGKHGRNGKRGDFLYVIGDAQSWIKQALP